MLIVKLSDGHFVIHSRQIPLFRVAEVTNIIIILRKTTSENRSGCTIPADRSDSIYTRSTAPLAITPVPIVRSGLSLAIAAASIAPPNFPNVMITRTTGTR
jgi:hypothetical protein